MADRRISTGRHAILQNMDAGLIWNYIIVGLIFIVPLVLLLRKTTTIQRLLHWFKRQTPPQKTRTIALGIIGLIGVYIAYRVLMAALFALLIMSGIPCGETGGSYCTDSNFFTLFTKLLFGQANDV